jgi:hypothetical protein
MIMFALPEKKKVVMWTTMIVGVVRMLEHGVKLDDEKLEIVVRFHS